MTPQDFERLFSESSISKLAEDILDDAEKALIDHTLDAFKNQSFDGKKWVVRRDKLNDRPLLIGTTQLKQSIVTNRAGEKIVISSDVDYAEIHNEGGKIVQKPTWKQRMFFSHKSNAAGSTSEANKWAAMSTAKELNITIPQRQFIGDSKELEERVSKVVTDNLDNFFK